MEKAAMPLFEGKSWDLDLLTRITDECQKIGLDELGLSCYTNEIRIITSEQMLDAISMVGMPVNYAHFSFGREFLAHQRRFKQGGALAYEIVINTDPCLVFCMEDNTATMQALVIAHAGFGHNHFFKNNYLFKEWTSAHSIIDYLEFSRDYVEECEKKYGVNDVQDFLSACHTWKFYGIDRSPRNPNLSAEEERSRMEERRESRRLSLNVVWRILPEALSEEAEHERFPREPEENLLYFIEKNAPSLPDWKRELIRIVRKQSQYFYPQMLTKNMNEGFACFVHYYIMTRLNEKGLITSGSFMEFLRDHTNVIKQPDFDETAKIPIGVDAEGRPIYKEIPIYRGINPYGIFFAMFMDIKRICESPTEEDRRWFPELAGKDFIQAVKWAAENFRDESFIRQYLSPKVIRDYRLFSVHDDETEEEVEITSIHDGDGYRSVRETMANMYNFDLLRPDIKVYNVDQRGDRTLTLRHTIVRGQHLDTEETKKALAMLGRLWEHPIQLISYDHNGNDTETWSLEDDEVTYAINSDN
jgi:stage V sporulation protein R